MLGLVAVEFPSVTPVTVTKYSELAVNHHHSCSDLKLYGMNKFNLKAQSQTPAVK